MCVSGEIGEGVCVISVKGATPQSVQCVPLEVSISRPPVARLGGACC